MTTVQKDMRGNWRAKDVIQLGNNKVLEIATHKVGDGSIVTSATVNIMEGGFATHRVFTDFSKRLLTSKVRCTEKNVGSLHETCMVNVPALKEAIAAFYKEEVAAA